MNNNHIEFYSGKAKFDEILSNLGDDVTSILTAYTEWLNDNVREEETSSQIKDSYKSYKDEDYSEFKRKHELMFRRNLLNHRISKFESIKEKSCSFLDIDYDRLRKKVSAYCYVVGRSVSLLFENFHPLSNYYEFKDYSQKTIYIVNDEEIDIEVELYGLMCDLAEKDPDEITCLKKIINFVKKYINLSKVSIDGDLNFDSVIKINYVSKPLTDEEIESIFDIPMIESSDEPIMTFLNMCFEKIERDIKNESLSLGI